MPLDILSIFSDSQDDVQVVSEQKEKSRAKKKKKKNDHIDDQEFESEITGLVKQGKENLKQENELKQLMIEQLKTSIEVNRQVSEQMAKLKSMNQK